MGSAYEALVDRFERYGNLMYASRLLYWDQQVMMPEGGTPARSGQLSALSSASHGLLTDDETGRLIDEAADEDLDDEQAAVLREVRREYERAEPVPESLVERIAETSSDAQPEWRRAKAEDDFDRFAPYLEELRDLQVERAEHIAPDQSPYVTMWEDSEPSLSLSLVEDVFDELVDALVPLIERIEASGVELADPFEGPYPEADQRALSEAALDALGYDWDRGRLDTAPHPFMSGSQFDARVTTRFREGDPLDAVSSTIHEFGHATYQLGLREDKYANPLGMPRSSGVHESQSRFWENHVGRTRPFWEFFLDTFTEHIDGHDDLAVDEVYEAFNRIYPDNLIRVEADELTYHLHIILRSEVGRGFVEGDIAVDELPQVWNEKMEEYLGVVPDTDTDGVLQDIHWTSRFAAFQGYTIGSVLAAQLDHALRQDLDVDALVREGEFAPIREWMTEHVHRHGQRYPTDELIEVATGEPLTAEYFVDYATEKFEALYGL